MKIEPTTSAWWNFSFVILTGVAAGSLHFAGVGTPIVELIKGWAADAAFIISCANLVFHLYSAPDQGPLVK